VTLSFIAAIVIILLAIILRQSALKNLRSSIKHSRFLNVVVSREWLARRNVFLMFMSHLREMLDDGYRTDCAVRLTRERYIVYGHVMELQYSLCPCCVPFSL
jgi:hypothetical protein